MEAVETILKRKALSKITIDLNADIELINQYALKTLTPEDVFAFPINLCDNEIDRDGERFTNMCLDGLAPLFLGKTGIFDHSWASANQVARLYKVAAENGEGRNSLGEQKKVLRGCAYIYRHESMEDIIAKIESGILREVSVGCAVKSRTCSICGERMPYWGECLNGHQKGEIYEDKKCFAELQNPTDAFEFSFCAVPIQPGAGVTKSAVADVQKAFDVLLAADLRPHKDALNTLILRSKEAEIDERELDVRKQILAENQQFLKKEV